MKKWIFVIILFGFIVGMRGETQPPDDGVRRVIDTVGYPWTNEQVAKLTNYLEKNDGEEEQKRPPFPTPVGGIAPHDDYLYSARVALPLFKRIKAKEVVIFGVVHRPVRKRLNDPQGVIILDNHRAWQGIDGNVPVSSLRDYLITAMDKKYLMVSNEAHRLEHSIEGMIPFLHYFNREVKITPIMVAGMDLETMKKISAILAGHINHYMKANKLEAGEDVYFLISADANHYGKDFDNVVFGEGRAAHKRGVAHDRKLALDYLSGPVSEDKLRGLTANLWGKTYQDYGDVVWCGKYSIPMGMLTMRALLADKRNGIGLRGRIIDYSDTYSEGVLPIKDSGMGITAPFSFAHWVGFLSAEYWVQ